MTIQAAEEEIRRDQEAPPASWTNTRLRSVKYQPGCGPTLLVADMVPVTVHAPVTCETCPGEPEESKEGFLLAPADEHPAHTVIWACMTDV